jgi:hypothetical protein
MAGPIDLRWDGAVYYVLGTSLAEGKGYRLLNEPGEIEAIQYPPLLPLFIAAHQLVLRTSDHEVVGRWLKLSFFFIYAALIFATYAMLRMYFPVWLAFFGTLILLLNFLTIFFSGLCFADIPFALATVLFVICTRKSSGPIHGAFGGVFATVAFLLRSAGVALFAAWIIAGLVKKEFKKAAVRLLIASVSVLAWHLYILHVQHSPSYSKPAYTYQRAAYMFYNVSYATNLSLTEPFRPELGKATPGQLIGRVTANLLKMPVSLGEAVTAEPRYWEGWRTRAQRWFLWGSMMPRWLFYLPPAFIGGLIIGGALLLVSRGELIVPAYISAAIVVLCTTAWVESFRRYLNPVAPFLLVALLACLWTLGKYCRGFRRDSVKGALRIVIAVVSGFILISESHYLFGMYRNVYQRVQYENRNGRPVDYRLFYYWGGYRSLDAGLDWLKRRAKPDDVVAASMPQWVYLRTGLKAVMAPCEPNLETEQTFLDSVPVAYIVLDSETGVNYALNYVMPLVLSAPQYWKLVYTDDEEGGLQIYERVKIRNSDEEKSHNTSGRAGGLKSP